MQCLADALLEYEIRQHRAVQEVSLHAYLVEAVSSSSIETSVLGGRPLTSGRRRGFRSRVQCQICGRFRHWAQKFFYHFNREYDAPASSTSTLTPASHSGYGAGAGVFCAHFETSNAPLAIFSFPTMGFD